MQLARVSRRVQLVVVIATALLLAVTFLMDAVRGQSPLPMINRPLLPLQVVLFCMAFSDSEKRCLESRGSGGHVLELVRCTESKCLAKQRPQHELVLPTLRHLEPRIGPEHMMRSILAATRAISGARRGIVVDVGANAGAFSDFAAAAGYDVVAFEPKPTNVVAFAARVVKKWGSRVRLVQKGVGEKASKVMLRGGTISQRNRTAVDVGASVVKTSDCGTASGVSCDEITITTLDAELLTMRERVAVLKMDIQGLETAALRGARALFSAERVDVVILEFDPFLQRSKGGNAIWILRCLHHAGFFIFEGARVVAGGKPSFEHNYGPPSSFEAFVRELKAAGRRANAEGGNAYTDLVAVHHSLLVG